MLIDAAFAFIGTEITAIAAAETSNPRQAIPRAIKGVWIRLALCKLLMILLSSPPTSTITVVLSGDVVVRTTYVSADDPVYIASAFLIGLLVSPTDPSLDLRSTAAKSPFVIAIKNAGIPALPGIINAVLLSSAWSAGNADLCKVYFLFTPKPWLKVQLFPLERSTPSRSEVTRPGISTSTSSRHEKVMASRGFVSSSVRHFRCSASSPPVRTRALARSLATVSHAPLRCLDHALNIQSRP